MTRPVAVVGLLLLVGFAALATAYVNPENYALRLKSIPQMPKSLQNFPSASNFPSPQPNISHECLEALNATEIARAKGELWALMLLDATGKPPSDILGGNFNWLGSWQECRTVVANVTPSWQGQYCTVNFPPTAKNSSFFGLSLSIGLCAPSVCSAEDLVQIVNFTESFNKTSEFGDFTHNGSITCQPLTPPALDTKATVVIFILSIFGLLILLGSAYDVARGWMEESPHEPPAARIGINASAEARLRVEEYTPLLKPPARLEGQPARISRLGQVLLCFSALANGKKVFHIGQSSDGTIDCLHGVRFFSLCWVIMGHSYVFIIPFLNDVAVTPTIFARWDFQFMANATFSVDTFFVMSGMLMAYLYLKEYEKRGGKLSVPHKVMMYFHRLWRLTPPYMLVMMVYVPLFGYWSNGPFYPADGIEVDQCRDTWWTNLLYINNLVMTDKMCMGWSWYLSNDMQFFIISPLILSLIYHLPKVGMAVLGGLVSIQAVSTGLIIYNDPTASTPGGGGGHGLQGIENNPWFLEVYIKPYCRVGSYAIGLAAGYLLYKTKCTIKIPKLLNCCLWLFFWVMSVFVLYGYHREYNHDSMGLDWRIFYWSLSRIGWSVFCAWMMVACATGNGGFVNSILSWKAIIPLSRLTYCAYLVHPIVIYTYYLSRRELFHYFDYEMVYLSVANVAFSFGVAFFVSLAFEAPFMGLDKVLLAKKAS